MSRKNLYHNIIIIITIFFIITSLSFSCRKPEAFNDSKSFQLKFSNDTVLFDTVFATIGSATRKLMVYNTSNETVKISNIQLKGGSSSMFRINVDGNAGYNYMDIEILPKDSIFVFSNVTIDPTQENNPFLVNDEIEFLVNGNRQNVKLVAYGQNAHYIKADRYIRQIDRKLYYTIVAREGTDTTWTNDKPILIYGGYALIDSDAKLTIEEGAKIYCFNGAGIWCYMNGAIEAKGTVEKPIIIQGHRISGQATDKSGQWDRIWINESNKDIIFENVRIKDAFIGLQSSILSGNTTNKLVLKNCIVENSSGINLYSDNYNIEAENTVFGNAGQGNVVLNSGTYVFNQVTMSSSSSSPTLNLRNYYESGSSKIISNLNVSFGNSIVFKSLNDITIKKDFVTYNNQSLDTNYLFKNCLISTAIKVSEYPNNFIDCIVNKNPKFVGIVDKNNEENTQDYFELKKDSPAIGAGDPEIAIKIPTDIKGKARNLNTPDLGPYQSDYTKN
ncbi:MAG: hypothetical protein ACEPOV_08410 [Hyphomicrobiales bacterium]